MAESTGRYKTTIDSLAAAAMNSSGSSLCSPYDTTMPGYNTTMPDYVRKNNIPTYNAKAQTYNARGDAGNSTYPRMDNNIVELYGYDPLSRLASFTVETASEYVMGKNVLGMVFPNAGRIFLLENLNDKQMSEVKLHESVHVLFPNMNERQVRNITSDMMKADEKASEFHRDKYLEMLV